MEDCMINIYQILNPELGFPIFFKIVMDYILKFVVIICEVMR